MSEIDQEKRYKFERNPDRSRIDDSTISEDDQYYIKESDTKVNRSSIGVSTAAQSTNQSWRKYPIFRPRDWYSIENRVSHVAEPESPLAYSALILSNQDAADADSEAVKEFKRSKYSLISADPHLQVTHISRDEERHIFDCKLNMGVYPDPLLDQHMLDSNKFNPWLYPANKEDPRFHEKLGLQKTSLAI